MQTFVWDKNFVTGLDTVDQQHHSLVDLFNRLSQSLIDGSDHQDGALEDTFRQLLNYANYHFSEEENMMRHEGVDARHIAQHHLLHERFIEHVASMWQSRNFMSNPAEIFLGFLTSWLGLHILGVDQSMSRQIGLIHDGETPASAYQMESTARDKSTDALLTAVGNLYNVLSKQNLELAAANAHLEERVAQRTQELAQANLALTDANHQLEIHSRTDGLLQISNRKYFDERLAEEWARAIRDQQPLGLLMIDVDYFKRYNDSNGHQAGDACLQSVAKAVLSGLARPTDLLARYGGEELVVILPNTGLDGAHHVALNICNKVAGLLIAHATSSTAPHVTVSIGAASAVPARLSSADTIIASADRALYAAKEAGRNRVCLA